MIQLILLLIEKALLVGSESLHKMHRAWFQIIPDIQAPTTGHKSKLKSLVFCEVPCLSFSVCVDKKNKELQTKEYKVKENLNSN